MRKCGLVLFALSTLACPVSPAGNADAGGSSGGGTGSSTASSGSSTSSTSSSGGRTSSTGVTSGPSVATSRAGGSSGTAVAQPCLEWVFDRSAAPFNLDNNLTLSTTQLPGSVTLDATGGDPFMSASGTANLDECTIVEVRYQVPAGAPAQGQVFWLRTTDTSYFSEAQGRFFTTSPGSTQTYRIDMAGRAGWNGTLRSFRFDPFNSLATGFQVHFIRLLRPGSSSGTSSSPAPSSANRPSSSSHAATPPPCSAPLQNRVQVRSVTVGSDTVAIGSDDGWATNRPVHLATVGDGSARVAWSDGAGKAHVTPLDANLARAGADSTVTGESVRGFVAQPDGSNALLVVRDDDMFFVKLSAAGVVQVETQLVGQLPQTQDGARFVHFWGHQGRLRWDGTRYHAYFGINQNFGATTGMHQGDTYYLLDAAGAEDGMMWGWGCSHSLDLRLAVSGTTVGAVCLTDAYPSKAIFFNHYGLIHAEPTGTMSGYSDARLGGLVGISGGFGLTFASPEGRCSTAEADGGCAGGYRRDIAFTRLDTQGAVQQLTWLTNTPAVEEYAPRLGVLGPDLLVTWRDGATVQGATLHADGTMVEGPVTLAVDYSAKDDIATAPNGDALWAYAWGTYSELKIVRVAACSP